MIHHITPGNVLLVKLLLGISIDKDHSWFKLTPSPSTKYTPLFSKGTYICLTTSLNDFLVCLIWFQYPILKMSESFPYDSTTPFWKLLVQTLPPFTTTFSFKTLQNLKIGHPRLISKQAPGLATQKANNPQRVLKGFPHHVSRYCMFARIHIVPWSVTRAKQRPTQIQLVVQAIQDIIHVLGTSMLYINSLVFPVDAGNIGLILALLLATLVWFWLCCWQHRSDSSFVAGNIGLILALLLATSVWFWPWSCTLCHVYKTAVPPNISNGDVLHQAIGRTCEQWAGTYTAWISNYIPLYIVWCNYLSMPHTFAPGTEVLTDIVHIDGLVQERRNSIASAMELRLSCTNPLIWHKPYLCHTGTIWYSVKTKFISIFIKYSGLCHKPMPAYLPTHLSQYTPCTVITAGYYKFSTT